MRFRALIVAFLVMCLGALTIGIAGPIPSANALTYDDIKNTGLANNCPTIAESEGSISVSGDSVLTGLCLQPFTFEVKEESSNPRKSSEFVPTKVMTRSTTTIDQVTGSLSVKDGGVVFVEEDGFDFQAITVQMPNRERVPFLFSVKGLVAKADSSDITNSTSFDGTFNVTSYRTSNFLDPKGRGLAAGYDNAIALPARADAYAEESVKSFDLEKGSISLQVSSVDSETGEISGTFESVQPSDTDMGTLEPKDVKIGGIFYARVESA